MLHFPRILASLVPLLAPMSKWEYIATFSAVPHVEMQKALDTDTELAPDEREDIKDWIKELTAEFEAGVDHDDNFDDGFNPIGDCAGGEG